LRAYLYPADVFGCGHHRAIWPATQLQAQGHDIEVVPPDERALRVWMSDDGKRATRVTWPADADVLIFQRLTHAWIVAAIPYLRSRGVAVVVDVDDDLAAIAPANPAFAAMHPRNGGPHSWLHLSRACQQATLVTVSTPALLPRYAAHGRGIVIPNTLAPHYFEARHIDSDWLGWPGTIQSHPNDPQATGGAVARLVAEGRRFRVIGDPIGSGRPFGLEADPPGTGNVELRDWPRAIAAGIGVGLVPLASTRFNVAKSFLKGAELAAAGVPFVASDLPEYARLRRMGAGVLAAKPADWHRELRRLLDEPAWRADLAERGRQVAAALQLRDHAWRWAEAWQQAVDLQRQQGPKRGPPADPPAPPAALIRARAAALGLGRPAAAADLIRRGVR
jgi:Glycosyl transferases group 1